MGYELDVGAQGRLLKYFAGIGEALANKKRRESFAIYAMGLLGSADRKSAEPLAAAASAAPETCDAYHQRLLHFLGNSPWSDRAVRREAAEYAIEAMTEREPMRTWIIDDTGFPKQGTAFGGSAAPIYGDDGQDQQLPDRRELEYCDSVCARADRLRAVSSGELGERCGTPERVQDPR